MSENYYVGVMKYRGEWNYSDHPVPDHCAEINPDRTISHIVIQGELYVGEVLDGKPDGRGLLIDNDGSIITEGYWQNGKKHGVCRFTRRDGYTDLGPWVDGHQEGVFESWFAGSDEPKEKKEFSKGMYVKTL